MVLSGVLLGAVLFVLPVGVRAQMLEVPPFDAMINLKEFITLGGDVLAPEDIVPGMLFSIRVNYDELAWRLPDYVKICFLKDNNEECWRQDNPYVDYSLSGLNILLDGIQISLDEDGVYTYYLEVGGSDYRSPGVIYVYQSSTQELQVGGGGNSSILFIPGFEASRLYGMNDGLLWEPTRRNEDVKRLMMDGSGESINDGIYTRDVIDEAYGFNVYKGFIGFMNDLIDDGTIAAWKAAPYDWRLSPEAVVEKGAHITPDSISYLVPLSGEKPYMIKVLEDLVASSNNGKVTIVGHSNGGLVAKALINKLMALKNVGESDLIDHIDRVILVATPQLGTPKAIASMLHGDEQNLAGGFLLTKAVARQLGENMPGAYGLLPSNEYFARVFDPVIEFSDDVSEIYDFRALYGEAIDSAQELQEFLLGDSGARQEPSDTDTDSPDVVNDGLLQKAQAMHGDLDNWQAPDGVEVIQVAGWGLDTIRGMQYDNCDLCVFGQSLSNLDRKPLFTIDGDRTVVTPSAVALGGDTYYVDLKSFNKGWQRNRNHSDIMEVSDLQYLIRDIVVGEVDVLPGFVSTSRPLGDSEQRLRLRMHSPVSMEVVDSSGKHTGVTDNPYIGSDIQAVREEIPNSAYFEFGETTNISLDLQDDYTVNLMGEDSGTFTLEVELVKGDEIQSKPAFYTLPVAEGARGVFNITQGGNVSDLAMYFNEDEIVDLVVSPSEELDLKATLSGLRAIIETGSFPDKVIDHLQKSLDKVEKEMHKGRVDKVRKELDKMVEYLDKEVRKFAKYEDRKEKKENKGKKHKDGKHDEYVVIDEVDMLTELIRDIVGSIIK